MTLGPTDPGRPALVTRLVRDRRRPGCVRVQLERRGQRTQVTVPAEVVERLGVTVDAPVPVEAESALTRAADEEAAFRTALRCLERRAFARRDLERRLVQRGHPPEAAERAVERAAELGLVNDETFARNYIETRFARGRGPGRLRRELTLLGVAPVLVDRLLSEAVSPDQARERMLALANKRAAQLEGLKRQERLRRVVAYLSRRGYTGPDVRRAVAALI